MCRLVTCRDLLCGHGDVELMGLLVPVSLNFTR